MILTDCNQVSARAVNKVDIRCVTSTQDFRELKKDWGTLLAACSEATVFNSWEWLFSWWQAYGDQKELRLLLWLDAEHAQLVGIAPLYLASEMIGPGLQCRVLRFLGDGSYDSDYLNFIAHPSCDFKAIVADLGQWLSTNNEWDVAVFDTLPAHSLLPEALERVAEKMDMLFGREDLRCGMTLLPGSFEAFLAERRSRFRTKLRSLLRSLDTQNDFVFENGITNLKKRLRSLFLLHELRWQKQGQPGVFGNKKKRLFYSYFVPRFARNGWLRFYSLRSGDKYLAHEMCFGKNGQTLLLQEGFDVADEKASYGQMLRAIIFRSLIENGEKVYDFLGGYSDHKADWGASQGKMTRVVVAKKNWRGHLYFKMPVWREKLATQAKQMMPEKLLQIVR